MKTGKQATVPWWHSNKDQKKLQKAQGMQSMNIYDAD